MQFDWSTLGNKSPTALVRARNLTHHAVQWVSKAARANLEAVADDSHAGLFWNTERGAFLSQPLAAGGAMHADEPSPACLATTVYRTRGPRRGYVRPCLLHFC